MKKQCVPDNSLSSTIHSTLILSRSFELWSNSSESYIALMKIRLLDINDMLPQFLISRNYPETDSSSSHSQLWSMSAWLKLCLSGGFGVLIPSIGLGWIRRADVCMFVPTDNWLIHRFPKARRASLKFSQQTLGDDCQSHCPVLSTDGIFRNVWLLNNQSPCKWINPVKSLLWVYYFLQWQVYFHQIPNTY